VESLTPLNRENDIDCPSVEIAAYLDGELTDDAAFKLEEHFANCNTCKEELNEQKSFINALNTSLTAAPELPSDFTKRIVIHAESEVGGLRKRNEALNAMFVSVGLLLFILFTLGAKAVGTFSSFFGVFAGIFAAAVVAARFVFDIVEGVFIILRTLTAQPVVSIPLVLASLALVAVLSYFLFQTRKTSSSRQIESGNVS
jgi:predicted anti-sigma-YlaC factor YlaD